MRKRASLVPDLLAVHEDALCGAQAGRRVIERRIRRAILKAIAIPGYQVPFASREVPMPYGWGTGGVQVTAAILGPDDVLTRLRCCASQQIHRRMTDMGQGRKNQNLQTSGPGARAQSSYLRLGGGEFGI